MIKILNINTFYYPRSAGGAEKMVQTLAEGLKGIGFRVSVLSLSSENDSTYCVNGITVYSCKIRNLYLPYFVGKRRPNKIIRSLWHIIDIYNPLSKKMVKDLLKKVRPDIVICHNMQGLSAAVWSALNENNVPFIQVLHDQYLLCHRNMFKNNTICNKQCILCKVMSIPYKLLSNYASAVIGVSNFILRKITSYGLFALTPIKETIYNISEVYPRNRRRYDGFIHYGFIGSISPNKGIERLMKAFININIPNSKLIIAGTGEKKYLELLRKLYSDSRIEFLGYTSPSDFFSKVDVTIVPSMWEEAFGKVIIESHYNGIPVIGSNLGGIPEIIEDGLTGMLFNPYSPDDLEKKMLDFYHNIRKWEEKSDLIKERSVVYFDKEAWLAKWVNVINNVINRG